MAAIQVYFNDYELSGIPGVTFRQRRVHKLPSRNNKLYHRAMADGQKFVRSEYNERVLVLEGDISRDSRTLMEATRDTLLQYLQPTDADLKLEIAGANRLFDATMKDFMISDDMGGFATFSIEFDLSTPFAMDTALTTLLNSVSQSNPITSWGFLPTGSVYIEPTIQVTVTTMTGGTNASITLENPTTGQSITVQRSWTNGDVLLVDVDARKVYVNSVEVEYSGAFPIWDVGSSGLLKYTDTFTTRAAAILMRYRKRWL